MGVFVMCCSNLLRYTLMAEDFLGTNPTWIAPARTSLADFKSSPCNSVSTTLSNEDLAYVSLRVQARTLFILCKTLGRLVLTTEIEQQHRKIEVNGWVSTVMDNVSE